MSEAIRKSAAPLRRPAPQEAPKGTPGERESSLGAFPQVRLRRNRSAGWVRRLVAEHRLGTDALIWPVFVPDGTGRQPVAPLPGVDRPRLACLAAPTGPARAPGHRHAR